MGIGFGLSQSLPCAVSFVRLSPPEAQKITLFRALDVEKLFLHDSKNTEFRQNVSNVSDGL